MPTPTLFATLLFLQSPSPPSLPDPLQAGWRGKPVCERLIEDERHRVLRCTFPPGGGHDIHYHPPHVGYALSGGRMQITDAAGVRMAEIRPGSTFTSAGIERHEVRNVGDTTVQYLIVESKRACPCEPKKLGYPPKP